MITFPKDFKDKPVGIVAKEIIDVIKSNNLSLDDILPPAYQYWSNHESLKVFHALGLLASQVINRKYLELKPLQEKLTQLLVEKEDKKAIWQLMTSQLISLNSLLKMSLIKQKHDLTFSLLRNPQIFLNEYQKEDFLYDIFEFTNLDNTKTIINELVHQGYNVEVTIGTCNKLFEHCIRGNHFDTIDYMEKKYNLQYKYMDELLHIALEDVFNDQFFSNTPIEKHIAILAYTLNKSWIHFPNVVECYIEQCGHALTNNENYLSVNIFDKLAQVIDFLIEKNNFDPDIDNLTDRLSKISNELSNKFIHFYQHDYIILKEKRILERNLKNQIITKTIKV